jgi:hypothetical protein
MYDFTVASTFCVGGAFSTVSELIFSVVEDGDIMTLVVSFN